MSETHLVRLNKFISDTGYCSRREADALIAAGKVTVNGQSAEIGLKVSAGDTVLVDGKPLKNKPKRVYIAYHKPVGITCTTERKVAGNIIDALKYPERIFPIGRLDKPSEGLIFLTNDGDIVNKVLRAGNAHEKEYVVTVNKPITEHFIKRMSQGVPILDTVTLPCKVRQVSRNTFNIILTQGLNRQIRRMAEFLGYEVVKLKRTRIMHVRLAELKVGQWRLLDAYEVAELEQLVQHSSSVSSAVANNALNQDHEE
ncbi:pseudouridine synthase [Alishewanella sp. WH16-1]|nr:23S rRNA pseudouridine(2604) synthase RluF [Alishewanella sp. WH16-1]KRS22190.1 pseudouridine synthase [Alishewanella sp. WH16-1]